jgi:hypothetical protein
MKRCSDIINGLGQQYSIQTFDQQLYAIAKQVGWAMPSVLKGKIQGSRTKGRRRTHTSSDELSIPSAHSAILLKAFEIREGLPRDLYHLSARRRGLYTRRCR